MKNQIKVVLGIIVIVIVFLLMHFVFYDKYKMPKGAEILISNSKIDVYSNNINLYDLIKTSNVEILTENMPLQVDIIGNKTITISYKYKNGLREYLYDINYEVVDSISPIFIKAPNSSKTFYVNEASNKDIEKIIEKTTFGDNYDTKPTLNTIGTVDFSKVGTYKLTFELSDSSNNRNSKDIEIKIKERPKVQNDENIEDETEEEDENLIQFEDQIQKYKTNNTMIGIDVSKWQGEIDFQKVKDSGCEFVIIRLGVMKDKDSDLVKDSTFDTNYKNAKLAGLKVGVYIYSEANNVDTAISNADYIINELNGDKLDFPVVFDWESWTYFNSMEMNLHMLNEMYDAFSNKLKGAGYDSMLYASEYYLNNVWLDLKDYTLWVAKYSSKNPELNEGENKFILWQNANTGCIDGIDANVDLDIYYINKQS